MIATYQQQSMKPEEFCSKPWVERRALAWIYFQAADNLAGALGLLVQANDGTPAELGCAFANWARMNPEDGWCRCENGAGGSEAYFCHPDTGRHGWACTRCHGITQIG
jgi:hypothetical protein